MKTSHYLVVALVLVLTSVGVMAQPGNGPRFRGGEQGKGFNGGIPNLTAEQQTKIKDLRVAFMKESQTLRNQMGELKAKQKTLSTTDKPDMKAIEANIDDITKIQNQMMKKHAALQQQIRAQLNDEQKLWFDNHPMRKGMKGNRQGMHQGRGRGMGMGMGPRQNIEREVIIKEKK